MTVKKLRKLLKRYNKSAVVMITNGKNVVFDNFEIGYSKIACSNSNFGLCGPKKCTEVYLMVVTDKRD